MQHEKLIASLEAAQSLRSDGAAEALLDAYDAFPVMSCEWHSKKDAIYVPVEVQSGFWIVPEWCADCLNNEKRPTGQSFPHL
jgi:ribosomal protein L11 methylase PrmA